jgi:hypothetical protein
VLGGRRDKDRRGEERRGKERRRNKEKMLKKKGPVYRRGCSNETRHS